MGGRRDQNESEYRGKMKCHYYEITRPIVRPSRRPRLATMESKMTIRTVLMLLTIILTIFSYSVPWWQLSRRTLMYAPEMLSGGVPGLSKSLGIVAFFGAMLPSILVIIQMVIN